jgi:guanylate kinase
MRPLEVNGVDYHFVDRPAFEDLIVRGIFLEYAEVYGEYYGTSKDWVENQLARGLDVILEIDWQGAQQIRQLFEEAVLVYILPPSFKALEERLTQRAQDGPEVIRKRLEKAKEDIAHYTAFDYLIINDWFAQALNDLCAIVHSVRLEIPWQQQRHQALIGELLNAPSSAVPLIKG